MAAKMVNRNNKSSQANVTLFLLYIYCGCEPLIDVIHTVFISKGLLFQNERGPVLRLVFEFVCL